MPAYMAREEFLQPNDGRHTGNVGTVLGGLARSATRRLKRNRTRAALRAMSDRELRDIGLYRGDIPHVLAALDETAPGRAAMAPTAARLSA
ncbi:DUF1127 domain-containing protein [Oceaniglobus indicus]|uniref:DUF1127 domain-containing protein n=1 Tax=Oceaniglobus indicus TaxID=2047749 RepID=UPI0019D4D709|nr:DUF1127 domain-containing protein [Oceaniglobus indicus]